MWGLVGHPELGRFKFGYGYVGESDAGTWTALILCMKGAEKMGALSIDDVGVSNSCGQSISDVEKAKFHSGRGSTWLLDRMRLVGPEYLDAVTTYEKEVISFNRANANNLREPLVAAYPQDDTEVGGHPYVILDGAD